MFHNDNPDRPRPTLENRNCFFEFEYNILFLSVFFNLNKNSKFQMKSTKI